MKHLWDLLDLEQKSSADEREAYKGTLSEETAIQKEHEKNRFLLLLRKIQDKSKIILKKSWLFIFGMI